MDEEQIKALISTALTDFETKIVSTIDSKNQGLAANLTREIKKAVATPEDKSTDDKSEGKLSMKALQSQISDLTKQLTEEKEAKFRSASNAALTAAIADSGAQNTTTLRKLLTAEYSGKLKEEDGSWFVTDGDKTSALSESIKSYLATDEGKIFVPATGTNGAGSKETKSTSPASSSGGTVTDSALAEAFAGI